MNAGDQVSTTLLNSKFKGSLLSGWRGFHFCFFLNGLTACSKTRLDSGCPAMGKHQLRMYSVELLRILCISMISVMGLIYCKTNLLIWWTFAALPLERKIWLCLSDLLLWTESEVNQLSKPELEMLLFQTNAERNLGTIGNTLLTEWSTFQFNSQLWPPNRCSGSAALKECFLDFILKPEAFWVGMKYSMLLLQREQHSWATLDRSKCLKVGPLLIILLHFGSIYPKTHFGEMYLKIF